MKNSTDLVVKISGKIQESNFDEWKQQLLEGIEACNKELKTDDDFVVAEKQVKQFDAWEKSIAQAKTDALEQAIEIQQLFESLDEVSETTSSTRLALTKQIKSRKENLKNDLIDEYHHKVNCHYAKLSDENKDFRIAHISIDGFNRTAFADQTKRKKSLKTMEEALSAEADRFIGLIDASAAHVFASAQIIDVVDEDHAPLFQDRASLLNMMPETLEATISGRIATYKAQQAEAENKRIRDQQEAERLTAELAAKEEPGPEPENNVQVVEQAEPEVVSSIMVESPPCANFSGQTLAGSPITGATQGEAQPLSMPSNVATKETYQLTVLMECGVDKAKEIAEFIDNVTQTYSGLRMKLSQPNPKNLPF